MQLNNLKKEGYIRKMLTASGGPLKIKFTPEQITYFESQGLPLGMNNSGGQQLKTEGVQVQLYQELKKKRKEEEIKSRMERRPVLKRKATTAEKIKGKKDEYKLESQVVGMSGTDPVGEFVLAGVGLNGVGALAKTGLWNVAKYAPTTLLGNWGRNYFIGDTFKNVISNGTKYPVLAVVKSPIVVSEEARKAYVPTRMNFSKTSFPKLDIYKGAFPIKMDKPFMYDELSNMFIPNKNYYYRRGWGIIDDAIKTGRIRVPEGDYKAEALKKYPWLDNGNPFSTALLNHKFPYFSEGELWNAMGKFGVEPEDLIAVPNNVSGVKWVAGSKFGTLLKNKKPSEVGGRATPLVNGETNSLPTSSKYLYKFNVNTGRYEPVNVSMLERPIITERSSTLTKAEKAGIPKEERNFTPKWHVANYPGYLLKGLMKGSLLEKQLSKNGTININLLNAYFNKASQIEREIANKVLAEKFAGLKTVDYNLFKKAVLDELIGKYNRVPLTEYADYGVDRLGYNLKTVGENELPGLPNLIILGLPVHYIPPGTKADPINLSTFTFESPRIPLGNGKHYNASTLGHSRTYTTPEEPKVLHVMESQSDWGLTKLGNNSAPYTGTTQYLNDPTSYRKFIDGHKRLLAEMLANPSNYLVGAIERQIANIEHHEAILKLMLEQGEWNPLVKYLHDNYLQRQLQENLKYAAENGLTKMRYPTSETAAKIEGYLKVNHTLLNELSNLQMKLGELFENGEISWEEYDKMIDAINKLKKELFGKEYDPKHQTILKKYADFPKLFLKLFKDLQVRTVTDAKGNTWYEVDVPKGYLSREWQFKQGGTIRKMQTASGGPIKRLKDGYRYIPDEKNGGWDRISDNSMADVFATMEFTPKKTKVGSSITRKQSTPSKTYRSAYNPDDVIKGFNALTLGGLNNLSPTQWVRRAYDTGKLLTGNMTWSGYTNSWINGNNGVVSLNFKEKHPVLSNSINGGIDLATFSLPKVSLYPVHFVLLVATPITGSYVGTKLGEKVDKYLPKKIQGYGGMLGYMLGGVSGIGALYKNYSNTPLIHTKYKKLNDVINYPITTAAATVKGKYPWTKKQDIRLKRQLFDDIKEARNFLLKSGYLLENLPEIRIAKKSQYSEGELGHYNPYYNTITVKSTINPYSNLPIESLEPVGSGFKGLINHELTHGRLKYFGAFSEFDPKAGYYVTRKDIKTPVFDSFRKKKAGSWTASPDEFDAELSNLLISTGKLPIEPVDNIFPLQARFGIWDKNKAREIENLMLLLRKNREFFKDGGKINAIELFKKQRTNP